MKKYHVNTLSIVHEGNKKLCMNNSKIFYSCNSHYIYKDDQIGAKSFLVSGNWHLFLLLLFLFIFLILQEPSLMHKYLYNVR